MAFEEVNHSDDAREQLREFYKGDLAADGDPDAGLQANVLRLVA